MPLPCYTGEIGTKETANAQDEDQTRRRETV